MATIRQECLRLASTDLEYLSPGNLRAGANRETKVDLNLGLRPARAEW